MDHFPWRPIKASCAVLRARQMVPDGQMHERWRLAKRAVVALGAEIQRLVGCVCTLWWDAAVLLYGTETNMLLAR